MVSEKFCHRDNPNTSGYPCQALRPTKSTKLGRVEIIYPYRDIISPTVLSLVKFR